MVDHIDVIWIHRPPILPQAGQLQEWKFFMIQKSRLNDLSGSAEAKQLKYKTQGHGSESLGQLPQNS
jgi:hypothetical protein